MEKNYLDIVDAKPLLDRRLINLHNNGYRFSVFAKSIEMSLKQANDELVRTFSDMNTVVPYHKLDPSAIKIAAYFCHYFNINLPIFVTEIPADPKYTTDEYKTGGMIDLGKVTKDLVALIGYSVAEEICYNHNKDYRIHKHTPDRMKHQENPVNKWVIYLNEGFKRDLIQFIKAGELNAIGIYMILAGYMEGQHGSRKKHIDNGW